MGSNLVFLLLFLGIEAGKIWLDEDIPSPFKDFQKCNMRGKSNLCDPENLLQEAERYTIDNELKQFETRTRDVNGTTDCEKKGSRATFLIVSAVNGSSERAFASQVLLSWKPDKECAKAILILVTTEDLSDTAMAVTFNSPLHETDIIPIMKKEIVNFEKKDYETGMVNVLSALVVKSDERIRQGELKWLGFTIGITFWVIATFIFFCLPCWCFFCCAYFFCRGIFSCCCGEKS